MRIAVCDDGMEDALLLKGCLRGHEADIYLDADGLLAYLEENGDRKYDLYLLDIYMDKSLDGIELAKRIYTLHDDAVICFVSTSDAFYREAYDLYAIQYLLKPVREETVRRLLEKVSRSLARNRERKITFQSRGRTGSIPYGKVLYISSSEHTLSICCTDGTVQECKGRLSEMAAQVCGDVFMRCHQSFIVNMYHVENFGGTGLVVAGREVPVSRRYYAEVKKRYQEILFEEVD